MGVAGRLSGTVSPFRAEQGTSLETPTRARASSCQAVGTTWFFSSCGGILVGGRGAVGGGAWATWVQTQMPRTSQSQRQLLRLQSPEPQPSAALQTGPPATHRLVTGAANTSAILCQKKTCSSIQIAASLASYYPFTQIFRLISLQMGRINGPHRQPIKREYLYVRSGINTFSR